MNNLDLKIKVSLFKANTKESATYKVQTVQEKNQKDLTWGKLVNSLENHFEVGDKDKFISIVPASYKTIDEDFEPLTNTSGALILDNNDNKLVRRIQDNIKLIYLLILDVDGEGLSVNEFRKKYTNYEYFLYTSSGNKLFEKGGGERYRVIMPLSKPITVEEMKARKQSITAYFNSDIIVLDDLACLTVGQIFRLAGVEKEEHRQYYETHYNSGKLFDLLAIKPATKKIVEYKPIVTDTDLVIYWDLTPEQRDYIDDKANDKVSEWISKSKNSGNNTSFNLAQDLHFIGVPYQLAVTLVTTMKKALPKLKVKFDPEHQVRSVYEHRGGEKTFDQRYFPKHLKNKANVFNQSAPMFTKDEYKADVVISNVVTLPIKKSQLNLYDLSSKKITALTGLPGSGKSWRLCKLAAKYLLKNRMVIYVVPDIRSMSAGEEGSRYNDLLIHINKLPVSNKAELKERVYTVFYDAEEKNKSVSVQFELIIDNAVKNEGKVLFITTAALKLVDFDKIPNNSVLMIDDSNDIPQTQLLGKWQKSEVDMLKSLIVFDKKGECFKVKSASKDGIDYLELNKDKGDKHPMYSRIKTAHETTKNNLDQYYVINEGKNSVSSVYRTEIISSNILEPFSDVYFAGDEIEYNPYLIIWKNAGAKIQYVDLPCLYKNIESQLTIHYCTEYNYSKTKAKTLQSIPTKLAAVICDKFKDTHTDALLCMNLDQRDQVMVLNNELSKIYTTKSHSPNTKGINNLKNNTLIVNAFKCDLPNDIKGALSHITGLEMDEIETFLHRNLLMQNLFRGTLRDRNSNKKCDYIAPSKKDAEYLQNRLTMYGFTVNITLLDKELSEMFLPSKRGVKPANDRAMTGSERERLSQLRTDFGHQIDLIGDNVLLLKTMKGLRGKNKTKVFHKLLNSKNKKTNNANIISFEEMKQKMLTENVTPYIYDVC